MSSPLPRITEILHELNVETESKQMKMNLLKYVVKYFNYLKQY